MCSCRPGTCKVRGLEVTADEFGLPRRPASSASGEAIKHETCLVSWDSEESHARKESWYVNRNTVHATAITCPPSLPWLGSSGSSWVDQRCIWGCRGQQHWQSTNIINACGRPSVLSYSLVLTEGKKNLDSSSILKARCRGWKSVMSVAEEQGASRRHGKNKRHAG